MPLAVVEVNFPGVNPTKLWFLRFPIFTIKLGPFKIQAIFFLCYKHSSFTAKMEEIFVSQRKKFGKIDSSSLGKYLSYMALLAIKLPFSPKIIFYVKRQLFKGLLIKKTYLKNCFPQFCNTLKMFRMKWLSHVGP